MGQERVRSCEGCASTTATPPSTWLRHKVVLLYLACTLSVNTLPHPPLPTPWLQAQVPLHAPLQRGRAQADQEEGQLLGQHRLGRTLAQLCAGQVVHPCRVGGAHPGSDSVLQLPLQRGSGSSSTVRARPGCRHRKPGGPAAVEAAERVCDVVGAGPRLFCTMLSPSSAVQQRSLLFVSPLCQPVQSQHIQNFCWFTDTF